MTVVQVLNAMLLHDLRIAVSETKTNQTVRLNTWVREKLRPHVAPIAPDERRYALMFDKLQVLLALGYIHADPKHGWAPLPPGGHPVKSPFDRVIQEIDTSLSSKGDNSPFAKCAIFGDTSKACTQRLTELKNLIATRGWSC